MGGIVFELIHYLNSGRLGPACKTAIEALPMGSRVAVIEVLLGGLAKCEGDVPKDRQFYLHPDRPFSATFARFLNSAPELTRLAEVRDGYVVFGSDVPQDERTQTVELMRKLYQPAFEATIHS